MFGAGLMLAYSVLPTTSASFSDDIGNTITTPIVSELTDEKKAEIQAQHKEKLAQELAEGKISQEQYDKMLKNLENWTFPMMRWEKSNHSEYSSGESISFDDVHIEFSEWIRDFRAVRLDENGTESIDFTVAIMKDGQDYKIMRHWYKKDMITHIETSQATE